MEEKSSLIPLFLRGNQTSPFLAEKGEFKREKFPSYRNPPFLEKAGSLRGAQPLLENLYSLSLGRGSG
jgi:hypothetical protein